MLYTQHNTDRATVHDVVAHQRLDKVIAVDTDAGEIICAHQPVRLNAFGEVDIYKVRFASVYPIFAGGLYPCMFHCYGRLA